MIFQGGGGGGGGLDGPPVSPPPSGSAHEFAYWVVLFGAKANGKHWHKFVCFVALRPKSTAMVMAGRSVHLTTSFPGQA